MIVVDTSALMAILQGEPAAEALKHTINDADALCMSAGTLADALIVAGRRSVGADLDRMIRGLGIEIVNVNEAGARAVAAAHGQWGKGVHPAGLNYGDCFAYALARERGCPLLFVGNDFSRTDAIPATAQPS